MSAPSLTLHHLRVIRSPRVRTSPPHQRPLAAEAERLNHFERFRPRCEKELHHPLTQRQFGNPAAVQEGSGLSCTIDQRTYVLSAFEGVLPTRASCRRQADSRTRWTPVTVPAPVPTPVYQYQTLYQCQYQCQYSSSRRRPPGEPYGQRGYDTDT